MDDWIEEVSRGFLPRIALLWILTCFQWIYFLQGTTAEAHVPSSYSPPEGVCYKSGIFSPLPHLYMQVIGYWVYVTGSMCPEIPQQVAEGGEEDSSPWPRQVTSLNQVLYVCSSVVTILDFTL